MTTLTVATLSLEEGHAVDLLPELIRQAGNVDLLCLQEGKNWHRDDGERPWSRAERLLSPIGLDCSLMTASARGTLLGVGTPSQ